MTGDLLPEPGEPRRSPTARSRIVRALLDALERRDGGAIGELLADDVVYHFPGRSTGRRHLLSDAARSSVLFRTLAGMFDGPLEMTIHDVVASEAHVVDLATYSGRTRRADRISGTPSGCTTSTPTGSARSG